jgi:hypothetical protein
LLDPRAERGELLREVCAGEQDLGRRCERAIHRVEPCAGDGTFQQAVEQLDAAFDPQVVG